MDQMEGMKMDKPLSSSFPIRSSARTLESEARPVVLPSGERAQRSTCLPKPEVGREDIDELSQSLMFAQAYCELI